jgi:hypothetical protein
MSKAFEEACNALQVFAGDEKGREIVATRIIDLARRGRAGHTKARAAFDRIGARHCRVVKPLYEFEPSLLGKTARSRSADGVPSLYPG